MGDTNYPNGFPYGVTIRGLPVLNSYPGKVFWVSSDTGNNGNNGTFGRPFADIDFAIGKCLADRGDIIFVKAGHTESLTTAGDITCDVAGVSIIGLGSGADRPTITFASTDNSASIVISAASVTIENIIGTTSDDGLTNPFHVQAADCWLDIEWRDASSTVEAACVVLTTQAADNITINLKYVGFVAGNACVYPINLIGVNTARINIDFYGEASTAVVNMGGTTASDNVYVSGYFYNDNTALTKNVVDTVTGSTWFAKGYDGKGGYSFSGGSAVALAADDVSTIAGYHTVPVANTSDNAVMRDVVGNKDDAAASGAVTTSESIMAYVKQVVGGQIVIDAFHDVPTANTSTNAQMRDVVGNKTDAAAAGAVTTSESLMAYTKQLVGGQIVIDAFHDVPTANTSTNAQMRDVVGNKSDAAATGAVTTSESLMAYVKQVVGGQIVIDAFHDVPTANTSTNAQMRDVVGNKSDAAASGAVTTSESLMAYTKQLVGGQIVIDGFHDVPTANTSTNLQVRDVVGNKTDTAKTGAVTGSASAMAYIKQLVTNADGLSALNSRYFEVHADFTTSTWGTTANTHEVVTVTGPCRVRMLARCSASVVANVGLLIQLGTSASTTAFIDATTASMIDGGEFWISSTTNSNVAYITYASVMDYIVNGQDIGFALSGHADGATGGGIVFHVWWEPLDATATCAAGVGGTLA